MIPHFQQTVQCLVGLLVGEESGVALVDDQGLQAQVQPVFAKQCVEAVAEADPPPSWFRKTGRYGNFPTPGSDSG